VRQPKNILKVCRNFCFPSKEYLIASDNAEDKNSSRQGTQASLLFLEGDLANADKHAGKLSRRRDFEDTSSILELLVESTRI
jgi:hypothetical protein